MGKSDAERMRAWRERKRVLRNVTDGVTRYVTESVTEGVTNRNGVTVGSYVTGYKEALRNVTKLEVRVEELEGLVRELGERVGKLEEGGKAEQSLPAAYSRYSPEVPREVWTEVKRIKREPITGIVDAKCKRCGRVGPGEVWLKLHQCEGGE